MGKLLLVVGMITGLSGCGGDDPPPGCQDAIDHYYGIGCTFFDPSTNPPTPTSQAAALNACSQINIAVPDRCQAYFDDWKFCLVGISSNTQCASCSGEYDALAGCD